VPPLNDSTVIWHIRCTLPQSAGARPYDGQTCVRRTTSEESDMRRAIIALISATALVLTGLTLGPQRATALGETSVTLTCTDDTSLTLLVDANELASLTDAVQAMIDYPAGLSCMIVQNPLPLTTSLGHVALAANPNTMIVAGGRWQAPCTVILPPPTGCDPGFDNCCSGVPGDPDCPSETMLPAVVAQGATRPALASLISPAPATDCLDSSHCVWVNIGVNLHFTEDGVLRGTLNETIPENQFCPDAGGELVAVGPSHFTSKPMPGCLHVNPETHQAAVITTVTHVSGLETAPGSGISRGFNVMEGEAIRSSFLDSLNNPGQQTEVRDMLNAPPAVDDSDCAGEDGTQLHVQQNGNINVYPRG
jgi:hypothetical protein